MAVNPGTIEPTVAGAKARRNRSFEYDSLGDANARFLLDEFLPEALKGLNITADPSGRAVCGNRSGGIAAFTIAWERPDAFRKVVSHIGSFTNIRGGHVYPALIRKTERKPIRAYLQNSSGDADHSFGHWPTANRQMYAALNYMGYDAHLEFAEGYAHNSQHGGSVFPDAMRWLWRKEKPSPMINTKGDLGGDLTLHFLLIEGEGWQPVVAGLEFGDAACTDAVGNFYFSEGHAGGIFRLGGGGARTKLSDEPASGLKLGPDGRLYGCSAAKKQLIALDLASGVMEKVAGNIQPNDFVITRGGRIYFTEMRTKQVSWLDVKEKVVHVVDRGILAPNGIALSPDEGTLAVSEHHGRVVSSAFQPEGRSVRILIL